MNSEIKAKDHRSYAYRRIVDRSLAKLTHRQRQELWSSLFRSGTRGSIVKAYDALLAYYRASLGAVKALDRALDPESAKRYALRAKVQRETRLVIAKNREDLATRQGEMRKRLQVRDKLARRIAKSERVGLKDGYDLDAQVTPGRPL